MVHLDSATRRRFTFFKPTAVVSNVTEIPPICHLSATAVLPVVHTKFRVEISTEHNRVINEHVCSPQKADTE